MKPNTVLVFKTDVTDKQRAATLIMHLKQVLPHTRVNFDLTDCDNILRIEGETSPWIALKLMEAWGHVCEELQD